MHCSKQLARKSIKTLGGFILTRALSLLQGWGLKWNSDAFWQVLNQEAACEELTSALASEDSHTCVPFEQTCCNWTLYNAKESIAPNELTSQCVCVYLDQFEATLRERVQTPQNLCLAQVPAKSNAMCTGSNKSPRSFYQLMRASILECLNVCTCTFRLRLNAHSLIVIFCTTALVIGAHQQHMCCGRPPTTLHCNHIHHRYRWHNHNRHGHQHLQNK